MDKHSDEVPLTGESPSFDIEVRDHGSVTESLEDLDSVHEIPPTQPRKLYLDYINTFKSFIGTNYLTMPYAFMKGGVIAAFAFLIPIVVLTTHCCMLLVKAKTFLSRRADLDQHGEGHYESMGNTPVQKPSSKNDTGITYGEVSYLLFGKPGRYLVEFLLVMTQLSFCIGYLIFTSQTISTLTGWSIQALVFAPIPLLLPLVLLRNVRKLAPFSMLANIAIFFGFSVCFIYGVVVMQDLGFEYVMSKVQWFRPATIPVTFGMFASALEGMGLILPVEHSMGKDRRLFPRVLHGTLALVGVWLGTFGAVGYLTFSDGVNPIITQSLPDSGPFMWVVEAMRLSLCMAVLMTYPLMMVPVMEILELRIPFFREEWPEPDSDEEFAEESFTEKHEEDDVEENDAVPLTKPKSRAGFFSVFRPLRVRQNIGRCLLVPLTSLVAMMIPNFGLFAAIVGAAFSSWLCFILPPLFHLRSHSGSVLCLRTFSGLNKMGCELPRKTRIKDWAIIAFGLVGSIWGSIITLSEIIEEGQHTS